MCREGAIMKKPDNMTAATWMISSALLEAEDLETAFTHTLEVISKLLRAEGGAIWILNKSTGLLQCVMCIGPLDLMGITFENGIGTEGQVVTSENSVLIRETEKEEAFEGDIFDDQDEKPDLCPAQSPGRDGRMSVPRYVKGGRHIYRGRPQGL